MTSRILFFKAGHEGNMDNGTYGWGGRGGGRGRGRGGPPSIASSMAAQGR